MHSAHVPILNGLVINVTLPALVLLGLLRAPEFVSETGASAAGAAGGGGCDAGGGVWDWPGAAAAVAPVWRGAAHGRLRQHGLYRLSPDDGLAARPVCERHPAGSVRDDDPAVSGRCLAGRRVWGRTGDRECGTPRGSGGFPAFAHLPKRPDWSGPAAGSRASRPRRPACRAGIRRDCRQMSGISGPGNDAAGFAGPGRLAPARRGAVRGPAHFSWPAPASCWSARWRSGASVTSSASAARRGWKACWKRPCRRR